MHANKLDLDLIGAEKMMERWLLFSCTQHVLVQVGSRVFLPNLPSVCALLYKIKHVVDITPLTFPKGMPDDFHPDTHGFKLTPTGEFIVEVTSNNVARCFPIIATSGRPP